MARQIYDWGKVDYGDIISFRYPSEGGMILNTVLVLQPYFIQTTKDAGSKKFIIHARKALLKKLSPKENLNIPTLKYEFVYKTFLLSSNTPIDI